MATIGIYAGSFDPFTNGHKWMVEQACKLCTLLLVVVADNPSKKYLWAPFTRMKAIESVFKTDQGFSERISVRSLPQRTLIADFAAQNAATFLFRGIRNAKDWEEETLMARMNQKILPNLQTVFLTPPPELIDTSSSLVKYLATMGGGRKLIQDMVPPTVLDLLYEPYGSVTPIG